MLARHGGAARASFRRYYRLDLMAVFRGELLPDEAWEMLQHLPGDSPLMAELASDPEYMPAGDQDEEPGEPSYCGWTTETTALADIYDMLAVLVRQVAMIGGDPPKIPPYPRPGDARRAALEEERIARARIEWADLCRQLGVE